MEITITLQGWDELRDKLSNTELIDAPGRRFVETVAYNLQRNIMQLTPVDTGRLRSSITASVDAFASPPSALVYTNVEYAEPVEYGGRPHWTSWTNLNEWAYRHNANVWAVTAGIAKHGTRAHHMFENSTYYIKTLLPSYVEKMARDIESEFIK